MRNGFANRAYCVETLYKYCKTLWGGHTPTIIFYKKDILKLPKSDRYRASNIKKLYGAYYDESDTIYINIRNHRNRAHLKSTIAHELLHRMDPDIHHGRMFDNVVTILTALA